MTLVFSSMKLQVLLTQLARYFNDNETVISADEVSNCYRHLSTLETSALNRLFLLLYQGKRDSSDPLEAANDHRPLLGGMDSQCQVRRDPISPSALLLAEVTAGGNIASHQNRPSTDAIDREHAFLPVQSVIVPVIDFQSTNQTGSQQRQTSVTSSTGENSISEKGQDCTTAISHQALHRRQRNQSHQQGAVLSTACNSCSNPPLPIVSPRRLSQTTLVAESPTDEINLDPEVYTKTTLGTCTEILFKPTTLTVLEKCRSRNGYFLQAIKESKATLPTGQGWEAAIATKKENADFRDLVKIYHRFECHNIYKHVVEAGFHTGEHWIRNMRLTLIEKLCRDFPDRFHDIKSANKCLNWVDQGCRYQQWAEALSEHRTDLGYLIALPTDIPHSGYTSRCTKEQVPLAVNKFKTLGITELVRGLELSKLGAFISKTLREMTQQEARQDVFSPQASKSPGLSIQSTEAAFTSLSGDDNVTSPDSMTQGSVTNTLSSPTILVNDNLDTRWRESSEVEDMFMQDIFMQDMQDMQDMAIEDRDDFFYTCTSPCTEARVAGTINSVSERAWAIANPATDASYYLVNH